MWPSLLWLTLFQLLAALQLAVSAGASVSPSLFLLFPGLPTVMWTYYLALRRCGARGFEMETIAFFLSTLSLAVTASSAPGSVLKQFIAILLGLTALVVLGVWLRDTSRTQRLRWLMAAAAHRPAVRHLGAGTDPLWGGQLDHPGPPLLSAL